jgi:hypothetical protein
MQQQAPAESITFTDPANKGRVLGWMEAERFIFIRPEDFEALLKMDGAERIPQGVAFKITGLKDAQRILKAATAIKK